MKLLFNKLILISLLFNAIAFNILFAQEKLEGYLIDRVTNQPVSFAYLGLKGDTRIRTISNEEGYFLIVSEAITDIDTLLISHISYLSQSVPIQTFRGQSSSKILLAESIIELKEIQINAIEDYQAFEDVVNQTKRSLQFPMTASLYYRELVKENKSFNKFADGLLTVVYEKIDDENKIKIRVDQCRTEKLPKDEDDQFEMVSPVKMEAVLACATFSRMAKPACVMIVNASGLPSFARMPSVPGFQPASSSMAFAFAGSNAYVATFGS